MYHTSALILRKDPWGEADCLVTVFTPLSGRVRFLAQGARKHGAKLQGHLEPGCISEISFVAGKNGYRLTTARTRAVFPGLQRSLPKARALIFVLTLVDRNFFEDAEGASSLFRTLEEVLGAIERAPDAHGVRRLTVWFTLHLLSFLGLLPDSASREASGSGMLFRFGAENLADAAASPFPDDQLVVELREIARHLNGAVRIPEPVLSGALTL